MEVVVEQCVCGDIGPWLNYCFNEALLLVSLGFPSLSLAKSNAHSIVNGDDRIQDQYLGNYTTLPTPP